MPAQNVLVIGLGYVGLPLAIQAARSGFRVTGLDTSEKIVAGLTAGRSHVDDVTDAEVAEMLAAGFLATTDEAEAGPQDVIVICVPTPLSDADGPDLSAVRAAAQTAGRLLRAGTLVSLESTTYPGTTEEVVRPLLEKASGLNAGTDFWLAFSPERIDPGNPVYGFRNTPKIVGGLTPACTDAAEVFYGQICDQVVRAKSAREAEMAKLLENTYRHVNIALVNEMLIFCRELDVDLWDAIRCAATKPFGFQPFYPGPGVGGHCIPHRPELPVLQGPHARLPIPVRRAGPGDQRPDARLRHRPRRRTTQHPRQGGQRGEGAAARRDLQARHRRPAGITGPAAGPQAARPRRSGQLPRPVRARLAGRRARHPARGES